AEFLTVDDDQRSIFELTNGAARSGGANVRKFSRQLLHRAAASSEQECCLACSMTERERDDAVVAGEVQVQLALWAPESTVADQRARCRPFATFAGVERVMQLDEALEAVFKHLLVGSVTRVGPIHERHVSGLADEETQ